MQAENEHLERQFQDLYEKVGKVCCLGNLAGLASNPNPETGTSRWSLCNTWCIQSPHAAFAVATELAARVVQEMVHFVSARAHVP